MSHSCCFDLDGRTVLLTGASSGLGVRFARALHRHGARLVLAARRKDRLLRLAAELGDGVTVHACDVSSAKSREALLEAVLTEHGTVDMLVNNAGIGMVTEAIHESDDDFERVISVNLVAPFSLSRSVATHWIQAGTGGSIVNIASILGMVGVGRIPQAGYAASKGGLINLTRELAAQWGRYAIRVNALAPGFFPSEQTSEMLAEERGRNWVARHTLLGRPGGDDELDGALLFLLGSMSAYVTGHVLVVDGGYTAV